MQDDSEFTEEKILDFWKKKKIFEKTLEKTKGKKPYVFYDGPPFATGMPHYGHLLGSITKDIFGRFWTMKGRYVRRVWGWDCHGLPIENIAEKDLGINSKDEIEKIGIEKFNNHCRSKVLQYAGSWEKVIERIGRWVDMKNSYKTMDNEYIESVWWAFKQLYEKGFIYKGEKILMYCPRCSTPLAKAEIAMDNSYQNVKEESVVVKFKLKEKLDNQEVFALAWTTTPWTLPSNLALTVNPKLKYVFLKDNSGGSVYLIGKDVVSNFFKSEKEYKILEEVSGKKLEGKKYWPLFDYFKDNKNSFQIILGDFVTSEDGTGIVHTAPAFGEEDYEVCRKYGIPIVQPVDEKGKFTDDVSDFVGKYVHDTNHEIIDFLKSKGKIVLVKKTEHEYPFCYRCDTKLIYRAVPAWFVDIQKIKPKIMKISKKINWYPDFLKDGRVKYTIETAPDWNISRNRYWASAIPIWESEDGERIVVGSIEELKKYSKKIPKEIDLHKDTLDKIVLEKNGKKFRRIPEVLDCWFESGAMTFAQFHYPFENKKTFEESFPSQFVAEYIAQVRAWFYYMMVLSAILFDKEPFENVVTTGTILAEDGEKMSKSKNNFTDPMILIDKFGADALRLYLMNSSVMNADNLNFSDAGVEEMYKRVLLLVYNVLNFYKQYPAEKKKFVVKKEIDKWILSRLDKFLKSINESLEDYNTIKASQEIRDFVEDLSTWYVRLNRDRFNENDGTAKQVLRFVLEKFAIASAPIVPFACEKIYQEINQKSGEESVHLEDYPKHGIVNNKLLASMQKVREIVSVGLKERDKAQIGLKWPLSKAVVYLDGKFSGELLEIISSQLNVKKVDFKKSEKEIKVVLDTKISEELEAEGFARELSRFIQNERKKAGLVKEDFIEVEIFSDFNDKVLLQKDFLKERINAKKILVVEKNVGKYSHSAEGKIKGLNFSIGFKKL